MTPRRLTIVGIGEALFDVFPDHQTLGGAPLNVAVQAHQLVAAGGGQGVVVSRVGRDDLGRRLLDELSALGATTAAVQVDDERPTGRVVVTIRGGEPDYEIVGDVAWDRLEFTEDLRRLAGRCDAVCFGTLGRRAVRSRETIGRFVREADRAVRLYDVNLRQDAFSEDLVREGCELASVVKLNEDELPTVYRLLGLPPEHESPDARAAAVRERFALSAVVLTRGARGTALYTAGGKTEGRPVTFPRHPKADSVGAGDACSAGVVVGTLLGWPAGRVVALADALGAFVASQPGATPRLPAEVLRLVADRADHHQAERPEGA